MTAKTISAQGTSAFCENMAMLLGAGIQVDEALDLVREDSEHEPYGDFAQQVLAAVRGGSTFAHAAEQLKMLPTYASQMLIVAEDTGTMEQTLKQLAVYYDNEDKLQARLKSAVVYPAFMLGLMALVLFVVVGRVLPTFMQVYGDFAGDITVSSFSYLKIAYVLAWVPLCVVGLLAVVLVTCLFMARTGTGRGKLMNLAQRVPILRGVMLRMAQARLTGMLTVYTVSGTDIDTAFRRTSAAVDHPELRAKADACTASMEAGQSLPQAAYNEHLFDTLYVRMLQNGARSGKLDLALEKLTAVFAQDADVRIRQIIDSVEPLLAAFLTVSVGLTLLSVMLPLVGILGAVG